MEWEQKLEVLEVLCDEVVDRRNSPASVDASINLPSKQANCKLPASFWYHQLPTWDWDLGIETGSWVDPCWGPVTTRGWCWRCWGQSWGHSAAASRCSAVGVEMLVAAAAEPSAGWQRPCRDLHNCLETGLSSSLLQDLQVGFAIVQEFVLLTSVIRWNISD